MKLKFEKFGSELIMIYYPEMVDVDTILQRLSDGEEWQVKLCFSVTQDLLRQFELNDDYDDYYDSLRFCIGTIGEEYTRIDSNIIGTSNAFYFANDIQLTEELFIAYYRISILRKIDNVIDSDMYIGDIDRNNQNIPFESFKNLVRYFPKTAELKRYTNACIANLIKEYFKETEHHEKQFQKLLSNRAARMQGSNSVTDDIIHRTKLVELEQFKLLSKKLSQLLAEAEAIDEISWQKQIHGIICLLYPKYIFGSREITIRGADGYNKRPDFLLVDANGYVDILEIKKPNVQLLTKQSSYRNNYVPVREFAGAIQQIEKYVYCLNYWGIDGEKYLENKLSVQLPVGVIPKIVNPQGILILGRSQEFNIQQRNDFELIKRQYKHIADIMTYDDLVLRIKNIIAALEKSNSE